MLRNYTMCWKLFITSIAIVALIPSCNTKPGRNKMQKMLLAQCDELDIIYYAKDSFVFKNFDPALFRKYIELITFENDASTSDCQPDGRLIFKHKGTQLFAADVSTEDRNCTNVKYKLDSKEYRHRLTYQTGMGMDQIYWHRVNPQKNPWIGFDTSKFHYEDLNTVVQTP